MHLSASPRRLGARARARLEQSRLRRGLGPGDDPAHAAARLRAFRSLVEAAPAVAGTSWRPLGPFAIPHGQTHGSGPGSRPAVAGRVTAVAVDPSDGAHLLLGTGGGGVWETRDGGGSWRPRTDGLPVPAIGAVAFDPGDPAVAYAGSGEGSFSAELGVGLLRSEDGGASWHLPPAGELTGAGFHDLAVLRDGRLLAATTAGLYESGDRGVSWTRRLGGPVWDLSVAGEVLAGCAVGLCRSDDGTAWTPVPLPAAPSAFERVAVCHAADGVAYVFAAGDGVGHLWRRDGLGAPFDPLRPPADLQSQQAWYAWFVAAPPEDPGVLLLGAVGLHRGVRGADGRWSWVDLSARPAGDDLPADQHAVAFAPDDPAVVYVGDDGGLFRSPDGGRSWRALNAGLAIAEAGHLAGHPEHDAWLLAGAGGLGTLRYEGGEVWFHVDDGDGGACAVDRTEPATCWHGFSGPGLARSERGGGWGTWQAADRELPVHRGAGLEPPGPPGHGLDPPVVAGAGLVVQGGRSLVVSADGGASWARVPLPESSGRPSAMQVVGPDRIWVGTDSGEVLRLDRTAGGSGGLEASPPENGGSGWRVAARSRPRGGYLSGLAADPSRPGVLWATWSDPRGGGVWRSDDAGASWADRGGGLPEVPVNAVAVDPDRPDTVLVGADLGVWRSDDAGASWRPFGRGLPATPVAALEVHRPTRLLRAALLGRGVWEAPLDEAEGAVAGGAGARLHLRGSRADGGRGAPFPAGRPDPFGTGEATWWWQSPDVKVEAPPDPERDPAAIGPDVFQDDHGVAATGLQDVGGRVQPGRPARVWVQVHNRGAATASGVRVKVLAAPAFLGWPGRLPTDPDRDPPPGSPWRAVGPPATLETVEPGRARVVAFDWAVPGGTVADLSLLALAASGGDPPDPGQPHPLDRHLGLYGVTVLRAADRPRVLRLEVWGTAGDPPFVLVAEPAAAGLVAGVLLSPRLAGPARAAGLEPARPPDAWRPELVAVVQQDPGLAERLDLTAAFPAPSGDGPWLGGLELDPERPEPLLLLLHERVRPGGGSLLLLDAAGRVVGGHTLRVPAGPAPA
ncbi:MAG TPA: hypothetical protein VFU54_11945 [Actinomycetota bacterium]|nr:hypothetical protein [Actinomycetota bacterium]